MRLINSAAGSPSSTIMSTRTTARRGSQRLRTTAKKAATSRDSIKHGTLDSQSGAAPNQARALTGTKRLREKRSMDLQNSLQMLVAGSSPRAWVF